jgi:autotransporter-associated beta strand protein
VLIKAGAGAMRLSSDNSFARPVQVDAGSVVVDGSLAVGADVIVNSGGKLAGNGTVNGNVTVNSGGTLSPGTNGIGTLTTYGAVALSAGSITRVDVNASSATSDLITGAASVAYNGALVVSNVQGTVTSGQIFTLCSTAGTGNFSSISPPPGAGLAWRFDPNSGQLSVVTGPTITPTNITTAIVGSNYEVSWPVDYIGWQLQVQTNAISVGLSNNWTAWPGSTTTNKVYVPIVQSNPSVFLRLTYPPMP